MARTFTLKDFVRRGEASPRRNEPLGEWLAALDADRSAKGLLGSALEDDVADPIGLPLRVYRQTVAELDDLAQRLVRVVWGDAVNDPGAT